MGPVTAMPVTLVVDTDVLVDFLRGHAKAVSFVKSNSTRIVLPSIVVAELYAGVKGDAELRVLEDLVSLFDVIPLSHEIAKAGGLFRRDYGPSHGVGLADAIVAATAKFADAKLKTLNVRHYPMLKGLRPAYSKQQ